MEIIALSEFLVELERTSSRIEITKLLAELFRKSKPDEIGNIVNLLLGQLAPSYEAKVFNIADRMMLAAIALSSSTPLDQVKAVYKKTGDIGNTASSLTKTADTNLSVNEVYIALDKIAEDQGEGSQERKIAQMANLLSKLDKISVTFVARIPLGKLRLGFSDKTILDALSWMERGDKSAKPELEKVYQVLPDVARLAQRVKEMGIKKATQNPRALVGVPIMPMLAQRLKSPEEMVKKMGEVAVEPKLDGLRLSIHFKRGKEGFVKSFTRNLNETSWMFPELQKLGDNLNANEVILDAEAVGVDEVSKKVTNFQSTMTRRRKHEIEEYSKKLPMQFYVFDILYKDGQSLVAEPYTKRREVLLKVVKEGNLLHPTDSIITKDPGEITKIHQDKIDQGLEGVIVKKTDSHYVPGRTGWRWVKMKEKEESVGKLADTVDCVVMGFSTGKGKRVAFGLGQFLAGVVKGESIVTVTKVGTGLTDEQFKSLHSRLSRITVNQKPKEYLVEKTLEPDFWVSPEVVVELAADEITKSPNHTAGFALRFPRLVRIRNDKSPAQATSVEELQELAGLK